MLEALPGREEELLAASLATVEPTRAEPGCLFFDVLVGTSPEGRTELVFYEAYADEAAFRAHMAAPHVKDWQDRALPCIDRPRIRMPAHQGRAWRPSGTSGA